MLGSEQQETMGLLLQVSFSDSGFIQVTQAG